MSSVSIAVPIVMSLSLGNVPVKFLHKDPHVSVRKLSEKSAIIQTPKGSESITMLIGNERVTVLPGSEVQIGLEKTSLKQSESNVLKVHFSHGSGTIENAPPIPGESSSSGKSHSEITLKVSTPQGSVPIGSSLTGNPLGVKVDVVVGNVQSSFAVEKGTIFSIGKSASQGETLILGKGGSSGTSGTSVASIIQTSNRGPASFGGVVYTAAPQFPLEILPPTVDAQAASTSFRPRDPNSFGSDVNPLRFESKPMDSSSLSPFVIPQPQSIPNVNQPSGGNATLNVIIKSRVDR